MVDYLVVAFPHPSGGWVAVMPDFLGVTGRGPDLEQAIERASGGAMDVCTALVAIDNAMPEPGDLAAAQRDQRWTKEYGIDWVSAIVRPVSLPHPNSVPSRRLAKRESKIAAWSRRMAARANQNSAVATAAE